MNTSPTHEKPPLTLPERRALGKELRKRVPRTGHAHWEPAASRPDPVSLLVSSDAGRVPELIPIRHGRMLPTPFTFFRGSAAAMAYDLAATPNTGIHVQLCGDCHLMNFGGFATPERRFTFDLTDFDETLPGPWEWDVKRLAASVFTAARTLGHSERKCRDATLACVASYRERMHEFAAMPMLDLWHTRISGAALLDLVHSTTSGRRKQSNNAAQPRTAEDLLPKITEIVDGKRRFRDNPPLVYHPPHDDHFDQEVRQFLTRYRESLQDDRRTLLSRYHVVDLAMKVVGVGSVGTRCAILLLMAGDEDALLLQYKEAGPSVLEPYLGKSKHRTHGQRVVSGQRLLQSASDMFLGWSSDQEHRDYYFRLLRDMKTTVQIDDMSPGQFSEYVALCGWALARGHAKSGDPAIISGYLGQRDTFDRAVASFAARYADQTERDHAAMAEAVKQGRLITQSDPRHHEVGSHKP
jgi:uncharacterized protein (DUF2252 family)